jgi:hypothetical protein
MSNNVNDLFRLGNPSIDPATGQALAAPPAAFTTGGVATDPTTVTLTVKKPDGTLLVYGWPTPGATGSLTREAAGRFYADVLLTIKGVWKYELAGTGAVTTVEQGSFAVEKRQVAV